jgi:hypothetical protein
MPKKPVKPLGWLFEISSEHYAAIGQVASNWAFFEQVVNGALWHLAQVEEKAGACLTAQIPGINRSLEALLALVQLRGGSKLSVSKLNKFVEATNSLVRKRNRIVHDPWEVDQKTFNPSRFEISAQKTLIFGNQVVPTQELKAIADEIWEHTVRFDNLMKEVLAEIGPSLKSGEAPTA